MKKADLREKSEYTFKYYSLFKQPHYEDTFWEALHISLRYEYQAVRMYCYSYSHVVEEWQADSKRHVNDPNDDWHLHLVRVQES